MTISFWQLSDTGKHLLGRLFMKQILILGCGYVGSAFAIAAKARGHAVRAVTRNREKVDWLEANGVRAFEGRVDALEWHAFAGKDVDWVLNCVSAAKPGIAGYQASYVDGNRSLVDWVAKTGFEGKAIYTSSVSVYPDSGGDWISEEDSGADSERARLMLESESVFLEGARSVQATVLRLGGIYGPGRSFLAERVKASEGSLPGVGDYYLNLIRLEDIVSAIERVFSSEGSDASVFNVVDDDPLLKADLAVVLAEKLGVPRPVFDEKIGEGATSRRWEKGRPANRRISNSLLREQFGWIPRFPNAREGMGDLLSD
ncbi:MAG: nucleoside-diphosphate-sugar epimerase [Candidatus Pelagisphaera sp.]